MSPDSVDISAGSVLHIKGYSSRGHAPKNKYLLILGCISVTEAIGFLLSSQLAYLSQESHRKEVVRIPDRATCFLRGESIIQCFELEYLSIQNLREGFSQQRVENAGKLQTRYLHKVRETVVESRLLAQVDIDTALKVLPRSGPK